MYWASVADELSIVPSACVCVYRVATVQMEKFEVPGAVRLTADEWSPDTGMLTDAMKLKRQEVYKKYKEQYEVCSCVRRIAI